MLSLTVVGAMATSGFGQTVQPSGQTDSDAYTRYELLAPGSAKFRIIYEVTATTPGATYYFNPIRKEASQRTNVWSIARRASLSRSTL